MTALKTWQYRVEAALIIIATVAMLAAPFVVGMALGDRQGTAVLVGALGIMAGFTLAVATVALDWIARDYRRAARR